MSADNAAPTRGEQVVDRYGVIAAKLAGASLTDEQMAARSVAALEDAGASLWSIAAADEEIADDLRRLGVELPDQIDGNTLDQTRRDQLAAIFLRRVAEEEAELAQLERSEAAEIEWVRSRYAPERTRRRSRASFLTRAVEAIAENTKEAGGYAKKKSREVSTGSYGYRSFAGGAVLDDEDAFLAWAETNAPEAVRVTVRDSLEHAQTYCPPDQLATAKREVIARVAKEVAETATEMPPGFTSVPDRDQYYAKPLPAAAIAGARVPSPR